MRFTHPLLAAFALCLSATTARGERVTLEKPVQISTVKADRKALDGRLVAYDDEGFEVVQGKNRTLTVRWEELGPPGLFNVRSSILGANATGQQWVDLGRKMLEVEGGAAFADRAFARAVKLNPKLKAEVEAAKAKPGPVPRASEKGKPETTAGEDDHGHGEAEGESGAGTMAGPQVVGRVDARTWGALTDEQQAKTVAELKEFADAASKKLDRKLALKETKYFLFYSDLPSDEAGEWAGLLDRMYGRLADLFAIRREAPKTSAAPGGDKGRRPGPHVNVWHGKALVFVFREADDYRRFQLLVHRTDPGTSAGMCHCYGDGRVHIAFYRQADERSFAHVLVHESVHGFVHRFRSPHAVPAWANEGLAEVIAGELVPRPGRSKERESMARSGLQRYDGLGGMLEGRNIAGWQYPVAETLCAFMIRQSKKHYVDFIIGIKDGLGWEESLEQRYKAPRDRLVRAYGESLGIKGLKE